MDTFKAVFVPEPPHLRTPTLAGVREEQFPITPFVGHNGDQDAIPMQQLLHQHEGNLVKATIDLKDNVYGVETLWAAPLGDDRYQLRNVPFLAYGFSEGDVVNAAENDGRLVVADVAQRSGHSTYRIFLPQATDEAVFAPWWKPLADLGCAYERANTRLIAIDVPPQTDVYAVYDVLERGEQAKKWEFEEGHCGHPLRE